MLKRTILLLSLLLGSAVPAQASIQITAPKQSVMGVNDGGKTIRARMGYLQKVLQPPFIKKHNWEPWGIASCVVEHSQLRTALLMTLEDKQPKEKHPSRYYLLGVAVDNEAQDSFSYYLVVSFPNGDCANIKPREGLEEFIPGKQQAIQFQLAARLWELKNIIVPPEEEINNDPDLPAEIGHACDPMTQTTWAVDEILWGPESDTCGLRKERLPLVWDNLPDKFRIPAGTKPQ